MRESIKNRIDAVRRGEVPEGYRTERAMLFPNEWGDPVPLNTVLTENKDRNEDLHFGKEDVLSVSGEQGIINQIDLLGRSYAGESVAAYHIVETGDVVYTKSPLKENPYASNRIMAFPELYQRCMLFTIVILPLLDSISKITSALILV